MKITIEAKKLQNTDIIEEGDYLEFKSGMTMKISKCFLPNATVGYFIKEVADGIVAIWRPV